MFKLLINAIVFAGAFAVKLNADTESSSSSLDAVSDWKEMAQTEGHAVSMEGMPDADDSPAS